MKSLISLLAFSFVLPILASAAEPAKKEFNICYFSLNKSDEYDLTKAFMDKLNANSLVHINVTEFQPDKDLLPKDRQKEATPNLAFKKMVESGTKCDGLVISGHHTGSYGGKRAFNKQRLAMDYMEALSCDPKYEAFFKYINAVWLQGCRTLGVGTIVPGQENTDLYNPDAHTRRVGNVVEEDALGQNFQQLNTEFTNTLDQDNPLSSRYLRLFPSAKLFGWTQTAPGEKANSQYSVLFHIAHMAKILDGSDTFPKESPVSPTISLESTAKYVDGVLLALGHMNDGEQKCEELTTAAWIAHGSKKSEKDRYAFDNADLAALTPLYSSANEDLRTMKALECQLKAAGRTADVGKLNAVLDQLTQRPQLIPYAFNSLVDLRNQLLKSAGADKDAASKTKKQQFAQVILERMKTHPTVKGFLENKINSKQVGILRKIDYYKFYNALTGETLPAVQAEIEQRIIAELKRPLPRTSQTSRILDRDYRGTLLESGLKNKLLSSNIADTILAANPEWDVLEALCKNVFYLPITVKEKIALLDRIGSFNQGNKVVVGQLLSSYADLVGGPSDRRYQDAYMRLLPKFQKYEDYWHGELHNDDGTTTPPTDPTKIPPAGTLGGPPGIPGKPGQPMEIAPDAGTTAPEPFQDVTNFFRGIFGR